MSYDLAVWEGIRAETDDEGSGDYEYMMTTFHEADDPPLPTPAIRNFVESLLQRWPESGDRDCPWSDMPVIEQATGPLIYLTIRNKRSSEVSSWAAGLAREQGLVCFDPQWEALRP